MKAWPLLALLVSGARARAEVVPYCENDPRAFESWMKLRDGYVGVAADDDRPFLDPALVPFPGVPATQSCPTEIDFSSDQEGRASDGIHPWIAAGPCKVTACGEPLSFEQNRGLALVSGEYDLNNNITLDEAAESRLDRYACFPEAQRSERAQTRLAFQEPRLCFPKTSHLHVEITPPRRLRPLMTEMWTGDGGFEWFRWRSLLHGGQLCAYGPFVADLAHAAKAEIHPAQLLWWNESAGSLPARRDPFAPDGPWALFLLQDASNRYSQKHHFILSDPPPPGSGWQPWAAAPVTGVFEVAFFTEKDEANPPTFELEPYAYGGLRAGSPSYDPCPQGSTVPLEAQLAGGEVVTLARLCDSTRTRPPAQVRIEGEVLCECRAEEATAAPVPEGPPPATPPPRCPRAGYLAKLTIRAQTGSNREWGEDGFALLLTDSRAKERSRARAARDTGGPRNERKEDEPEPQLSWKPRGAWSRVEPTEPRAVAAVVRWLFGQAGWPIDEVTPPMPSLWRLLDVALNLDVHLDLPEERKKDKTVVATWVGALVTATSNGPASTSLPLAESGDHRATLSLARLPALTAHRIQVTAGAEVGPVVRRLQVETTETKGAVQKATRDEAKAAPVTKEVESKTFVLWSHGLGATPAQDWHDAARALCTHFTRTLAPRRRESAARTEAAAEDSSKGEDVGLLQADLRVVVDRTLKDEVVSATELTLLVQDLQRLCRPKVRKVPPRPVLLRAH